MKVAYARDIFKPEAVAVFRCMKDMFQRGLENVVPLTNFLEFFWKWFNYHDVCNLIQHYKQRLDMKKPFSDPSDERLHELESEIPDLLQQWNKEKSNADLSVIAQREFTGV